MLETAWRRAFRPRSTLAVLALALAGAAALPGAAHAQEITGIVLEQGTELTVHGAIVTVLDDETGEVRARAITDDRGAFALEVPPGRYTAFAELDGLNSPDSPSIEAEVGMAARVELVLPSRLLILASSCEERDRRAGTGVVAGTVRDSRSGTPLPAASVVLEWDGERAETETDGGGRYLFCTVPTDVEVSAGAVLLGRRGPVSPIVLSGPAVALHDLEIGVSPARAGAEIEQVARPGPALGPSTFSGRIVDAATEAPVTHAIVRLLGTDHASSTDREGRFRFENVSPRTHSLEVRHLAYGTHTESVDVPGSSDVSLRLRIAARAIEIDGVTVVGRTPAAQALRRAASSRRIVTGATLADHESRGSGLVEVLRYELGALRVREGRFVTPDSRDFPQNIVCVESQRGVGRIRSGAGGVPFCNMIRVYLDDVRIHDPGTFLWSLSAQELESVELLTGSEASLRYGLDHGGGVLRLYSRGRGPYRDDPDRSGDRRR